ncbi:MAG TPA: glycosyl hydrolase, partial [Blastocatellia bacterium]|nr:glycosyl hydrolase [Blastocatellia bacterium]
LYKTGDYGKTWKRINQGIPDGAFTRVIREDPHRRGLLYAGTETGIYVSFNDGESWQPFQLNLPVVPITDLAVHKREKDLVVATQGRSFWILDDLTLLHQMTDAVRQADAHLFKPEDAYRMPGSGGPPPPNATVGANPPAGVVIYYYLKSKPAGEVTLEILEASGRSVKKFTSTAPEGPPAAPDGEDGPGFGRGGAASRVPAEAGLNRFVWDLRYPDAVRFPGMILWAGSTSGPRAVPGAYQVRLTANGKTLAETFELRKDPRVETTPAEFARQFELLAKVRDKLTETHEAIIQLRDVRKQAEETAKRVQGQPNGQPIVEAAKALGAKLTAVEEELYQTKNQSNQDPLNYPIRLNNKLAALAGAVSSADAAPTEQSFAVYDDLTGRINAQLQKLRQVMQTDLPAFNKLVRDQNVPAVFVKTPGDGNPNR